jgi:hypothetical protein
MTAETIAEHDRPGSQPGNPMSLPAVGYPVPLGGAGVGEYGVELE